MNLARAKTLSALETIISLESFTQYEVAKKASTSFPTAHDLIHYLLEKNVVSKSGGKYRVTTWPGLLALFTAFRSFPKPKATLQLALSRREAAGYLSGKGFVFCLTSAWQHYDGYLRDPQIHVYEPSQEKRDEAIRELSQASRGTTLINIYPQDLPLTPVKKGRQLITSLPRTLLDLYSSTYAYGTDKWIKKKADAMYHANENT